MPTYTSRLQIPIPVLATDPADETAAIQGVASLLDAAAMYRQGLAAARPNATTVPPGTFYEAEDTGVMSVSLNPGNPTATTSTIWIDLPPNGSITLAKLASDARQSTFQPGDLMDTAVPAGASDPAGWLWCDGRAISRTSPTYAALFAAIGTAHGTGDGSTTFNIPDFRSRTAVAPDNMGTARGAAGRMLSYPRTLGGSGGEEAHTLLDLECGVNRNGATGINGDFWAPQANQVHAGQANSEYVNPPFYSSAAVSATDARHVHGLVARNADWSHNNMQPYYVINKKIKL